jgi:hypothetical protein
VRCRGDFFDAEFDGCEIRDGARRLAQVRVERWLADSLGGFDEARRECGEFGNT